MEGYEADDVLGSMARIAAEQGMGVKIITGDRDLLQLVNARTAVYLAGDDANYITDQDVIRKLGVRPDQVVDYKAIVGDKSDNIPGVPGVGEKTAVALLEKYGTLDAIYEHLEDVEKRWAAKLEAGKESAYRSATIWPASAPTCGSLWTSSMRARMSSMRPASKRSSSPWSSSTLIKQLQKLTGSGRPSGERRSGERRDRASAPKEQLSMFARGAARHVWSTAQERYRRQDRRHAR